MAGVAQGLQLASKKPYSIASMWLNVIGVRGRGIDTQI
jgi:hypothetical protein